MEYSRVKYASFDDLLLPFHRNRNRPVSCVVDRVSCVKEFIQGWLYGVLDNGESGIFPCEYVAPLGKQEAKRGQRRELESWSSLSLNRNLEEDRILKTWLHITARILT
ncbi:uncharacterized protein TNCT_137452 [Trichonephila clavata]|uniref:Uncharacterized protein n=1 Tax=Trichonephila clavata TaxID=2740835 RepID=A0A8X6JA41_TRICU|nr:uncharacterized protein TNCT_137452 [Trichonephila clavata]